VRHKLYRGREAESYFDNDTYEDRAMSDKTIKRNLATAVGAALAGSMILAGNAQGFGNLFSVKQLDSGYMQVAAKEGSCGGNKAKEGSCGESAKVKEGSCGENKSQMRDGSSGDMAMPAASKMKEAKCGANQ
jgi:uncharacterized low-complexity protein